jgi:hypothetical protein
VGSILNFLKRFGAIPPHECAYGIQLASIEDLSNRVRQILEMEFFDPAKTNIKVSCLGGGGGSGIVVLRQYCAELAKDNSRLEPLVESLKQIEKMQPAQEAAIRMIDLLVRYRTDLEDEESQDEIIVFIHFGLKDLARPDPATREALARLVERVDTPKQAEKFKSRRCPQNFLGGDINIYPLAIGNTSWYRLANLEMADQNRPILELRFTGLGGVFIYLLDEIEKRFGYKFFHLDGESIDADRQDIRT